MEEFARAILAENVDIDILINNAGIMFGPREETDDGFESQIGVNHLESSYSISGQTDFICYTGSTSTEPGSLAVMVMVI